MPTIDSKDLIDQIISNEGHYEDDPRVVKIVEYTNMVGRRTWGVIYKGMDLNYYAESHYVRNPKTLWEAE